MAVGLPVILALVAVLGFLLLSEYRQQKQQSGQALSSLANIIGWNSKATLAFNDIDSANESLAVLKNQPRIISASLYDNTGKVVAAYSGLQKSGERINGEQAVKIVYGQLPTVLSDSATQPSLFSLKYWLNKATSTPLIRPLQAGYSEVTFYDQYDNLHLFRPVFIGSDFIGVVHLVDDPGQLDVLLSKFYRIIGGSSLFALLALVFISARLQRIFSNPILTKQGVHSASLNKKAIGAIGAVTKIQKDESGQLVDVYGQMLEEIHGRDELLAWQRDKFTHQVQKHTTELSSIIVDLQQVANNALNAQKHAEAANRAKSQFLATMSHEIRMPISAILGMVDFLWNSDLNDEQRYTADVLKQSSVSLLNILDHIQDFFEMESGNLTLYPKIFNCLDLVHEGFESLQLDAKSKGLRYRLQINSELPLLVVGDSVRIRQVLVNLLNNAVKFTAQGDVTLTVFNQTISEQTSRLHFEIMDTGIGIHTDQLELIFDAFSQSDSTMSRIYRGTGLGLAVSKELVQLMKGKIGVNSQPGIGSTFWFWVDMETSKIPVRPPKTAINYRFKANLLVAEDYPANQLIVERFLQDLGCKVHLVSNGFDALKALKQQHFDLVFMDCEMPFMDGYEATQEIRRQERAVQSGKHIPVIALTAHALNEDEAKCSQAGMDEWVTKPFTRQDLSKTLKKWLPKELSIADQPVLKTDINTLVEASNVAEETTAINMAFFTRQFKLDNIDDLAFITSLTQAFQKNAAETLSSLQHSIDNEDADQIRKLAHGLKSLSTNVGSVRMTELCGMIEQAGKSNQLNDVQQIMDSMKQEYLRVLTELNALTATVV